MTSERFWDIQSVSEGRVIEAVLKRRFPETFAVLSESLEQADPLDIVYPGNPDEYSDVVREIVVLLAPVNGCLDVLSVDQLVEMVREGLKRCFDEELVEGKIYETANLISAKYGE